KSGLQALGRWRGGLSTRIHVLVGTPVSRQTGDRRHAGCARSAFQAAPQNRCQGRQRYLTTALNQHALDLRYRGARFQSLRAGPGAIKNRMAAIELEWIFKIV